MQPISLQSMQQQARATSVQLFGILSPPPPPPWWPDPRPPTQAPHRAHALHLLHSGGVKIRKCSSLLYYYYLQAVFRKMWLVFSVYVLTKRKPSCQAGNRAICILKTRPGNGCTLNSNYIRGFTCFTMMLWGKKQNVWIRLPFLNLPPD